MSVVYNKFNRGEIDDLALARDDVTRVANSAASMINFIPMRLGPMTYRPGMSYLGETKLNATYLVPFVASLTSTAILEFTDQLLRIWTDDALVESSSVTTSITNGYFNTDLSGWVDSSEPGASSSWYSGNAALLGTGTSSAILSQTIGSTDTGNEHTMRVSVKESPVVISVGTSGAGSDDIFKEILSPGIHSLVFTPTSNITITFENSDDIRTLIDFVEFSVDGVLEIPTSVTESQLSSIRTTQSADVVFVAYDNGHQFRIERRGVKSWSVVDYLANDGPFGSLNNSDITLTAGALSGNTTLTANKDFFTTDSVGDLFRLASSGQNVTSSVNTADDGTDSIRVTGVEETREFTISIDDLSGTGTTVTLQRSNDDLTWVDVESYTTDQSKTFNDELDNAILYYRLWIKTGDYSSGTIDLSLVYAGGSIEGVCRVIEYVSTTVVNVQVLDNFGSTETTRDWYRGQWGQEQGYPTSVALYEGRLWWAGKTRIWGSVSDSFSSFDENIEGDSAPITKTIGFGPVDTVNWLATSSRLIMGIATDEIAVRSSSFGEILTAANTNLKSGSTQGVAPVEPVKIDDDIIFVQRSNIKANMLSYVSGRDAHKSSDLMILNQQIARAGIKRVAVVRQPETRLFMILNDGTAIVYTYDETEEVKAWSRMNTDGIFNDVVVLPENDEDALYFVVNRDGGTFLEKMSKFMSMTEQPLDSFIEYSSPGTTITGLTHLEGSSVYVWADNKRYGPYTVESGQIVVDEEWSSPIVGLQYTAQYVSNKISGYVQNSVLSKRKRIESIGLIARDLYIAGLMIGSDSDNLKPLPTQENGKPVVADTLIDEYDNPVFPFSGEFKTDSRVYITADAPCTIMALVLNVLNSKDSSNPA